MSQDWKVIITKITKSKLCVFSIDFQMLHYYQLLFVILIRYNSESPCGYATGMTKLDRLGYIVEGIHF